MKHKRWLSILLALTILLGCIGWTPTAAQENVSSYSNSQTPEAEDSTQLSAEETQPSAEVDSTSEVQETSSQSEQVGATQSTGSIVIDFESTTVLKGGTGYFTATTTPAGQAVTWSSSDSTIGGFVSTSGGILAAYKAGTITVTATLADGSYDTATVYIIFEDGVYRIQNQLSNLYLSAVNGTVDGTGATQQALDSSASTLDYYAQLWKVQYLGSGYYTMRPMHYLSSGLSSPINSPRIYDIGTSGTLGSTSNTSRWTIQYVNGGYAIQCNGNASKTLQTPNNSTAVGVTLATTNFTQATFADRWNLVEAESVSDNLLLIDTAGKALVTSPKCYVAPNDTKTLAEMNLALSFASEETNSQAIVWSVGTADSEKITISSTLQTITGVEKESTATLIFYISRNGPVYTKSISVNVTAIPEGTYFVRNKELENYMQLDNDASNLSTSGIIMEQWAYDGADDQKWSFSLLNSGYYVITSEASGMALTVKSDYINSADKSVVQETYVSADRQQWKITSTSSGCYIIRPKSGESYGTDWCLSAGTGIGNDGRNVEQRAYTNDSDFKDAWLLYCISDISVNLEVVYDFAYSNRYSDAVARINAHMLALQQKYLEEFGIWINYSVPERFLSYGDLCTMSPNTACTHALDAACTNGGEYHHKNIYSIISNIELPDTSSALKLVFIGHVTCLVAQVGETQLHGENNGIKGLAHEASGLATVFNFLSTEDELMTTIHEFGHLYGVIDHYGIDCLSTEQMNDTMKSAKFSENCIYGEDGSDGTITEGFPICEGCKDRIEENINRYNHN